jgi:hypothetical protein
LASASCSLARSAWQGWRWTSGGFPLARLSEALLWSSRHDGGNHDGAPPVDVAPAVAAELAVWALLTAKRGLQPSVAWVD